MIPTAYADSLAAYNTAVKEYDRAALDYQLENHSGRLWDQLQKAEAGLVEAAMVLAADVRIAHEQEAPTSPADGPREMAAKFIELADLHAERITTTEQLFTENFVKALKFAHHMVAGGSYSGRESQLVFNQLKKLQQHFV